MAKVKIAVSVQRMIPWLGYHHVLMIGIVLSTIVTAILMAGCGSSSIAQRVYLVQLEYVSLRDPAKVPVGAWENITLPAYEAVKDTRLAVRTGYFGLCATTDYAEWKCRKSVSRLVNSNQLVDPLGIISMAEKLKDDVVFPGFLLGSVGLGLIALMLFYTFPGWHAERDEETGSEVDVKPFPNRKVTEICCACTGLGTLFTFTSALWQHTASATAATILETSAISIVKAGVGGTATALAWLTFSLWLSIFIGTAVMILSITLLDRLTDND